MDIARLLETTCWVADAVLPIILIFVGMGMAVQLIRLILFTNRQLQTTAPEKSKRKAQRKEKPKREVIEPLPGPLAAYLADETDDDEWIDLADLFTHHTEIE